MAGISRTQRLRRRLLGRAFTLLYHEFAWAYDWVSRTFFRGEWRHWQRATLPALAGIPGRRVLEVGCGTGDLQADLAAAGYQPYGVDLSPAMLRVAARKGRRRGGRLRVARAATQALPFATGAFDAIVSTFPSEYIVDPRTLAEIARVLRPGGRLVIVPAGALLPVDRTARTLDRVADVVYGRPRARAAGLAARQEQIRTALTHPPAFGPLVPRLQAAGFAVAVTTAARPTSIALLVVADAPDRGASV